MLNLIFQHNKAKDPSAVIADCRGFFNLKKKASWFQDSFVREILETVDGATVIDGLVLKSKTGDIIPADYLSTGTKVMICIYEFPDLIFNITQMGNNVIPLLIKLCSKEDRTVLSYRLIPIYELSEIPLQKDYQDYQVHDDSYDDVDEWLEEIMND